MIIDEIISDIDKIKQDLQSLIQQAVEEAHKQGFADAIEEYTGNPLPEQQDRFQVKEDEQ